jgi:hypothetical protein
LPFIIVYRLLEQVEVIVEIINVIHGGHRWPPQTSPLVE